MQFSPSQKEAIDTSGKNIVVSASAGAGKTTVLVERLMQRMFRDKVSLDEIVAMTFTEAAASNMKKKLLVALNDKLQSDIDEETREFCNHQLILIENALICTMHSFSTTLIRNNYASLSLNPGLVNNVIDDISRVRLTRQATDEVFSEELESNFSEFNELNQYLGNDIHNFDTVRKMTDTIFKTAINTIEPDAWFKRIISLNQPAESFTGINSEYRNRLYSLVSINLDNIIGNLQELAALAETQDSEMAALVYNVITLFTEARELISNSYTEAVGRMTTAMNVTVKTIRKFEDFNNLRKEILNGQYPNLAGMLYNERKLLDDYNVNIRYNVYLLEITRKIMSRYQELKIGNDCMDFNDMEHYAYQILKANDLEVARRYRSKLKEIMVDEFQDTNDIQNAMIDLISNGHNVFRVGDMKQSIYKFRGAKPTIMQGLLEDDGYHNIYLPNNFRSSFNIVEFNNRLFRDLLSDSNININFTEDDRQIAELEYQHKNLAPIELINLQISDENGDSRYKENQAANFIAQDIIRKHLKEKYSFRDICILVRTHLNKIDIKYALNNANIPNFVDDHMGFLNTNANMLISSYFRLIADQDDDISLVSVLVSPMYNVSDDELVTLRGKDGYFRALESSGHPFIEDYRRLKDIYENQGLLELVNSMISINNYYHEYTNTQDRANIDLLCSNIESFGSDSLTDYLAYLDIALENNKDGAIPVSNEDDVVRVMTIHQSKGLEFEVVYIYDPSNSSLIKKQELSINDRLGIGTSHCYGDYSFKNPTIQEIAIDYQNSIEELSEFIRVFYVATTRAKNRLYLVSKNKPLVSPVSAVSSMIDRQLSFQDLLMASDIRNSELFEYRQITVPFEFKKLDRQQSEVKEIRYYEGHPMTIEKITPSFHGNLELDIDFSSRGMEAGTMVHDVLEKLPLDLPWTRELVLAYEPELSENQIEGIISLRNDENFRNFLEAEVHREYNFTIMDDNVIRTGIVDFISISDNAVNIIDYKTDGKVSESSLKDRYRQQLREYRDTFKAIYSDKEINTFIYSLTLKKLIDID